MNQEDLARLLEAMMNAEARLMASSYPWAKDRKKSFKSGMELLTSTRKEARRLLDAWPNEPEGT